MTIQVPNFRSRLLNRVAQGDMSIFEEEHDFTLTERKSPQNWNALIVASTKGHLNLVNRLLEIDTVSTSVAAIDNKALRWAASNGYLDVVNRLLEIEAVRANVAALDNGALRWAARKGHLEVVNRLLEIDMVRTHAGARSNQALRLAAENGHSEVVYALAKTQWPLGKQDIPEEMHQHLPLIKAGAQLYTAKREQERILISALQNKPVLGTLNYFCAPT